MRGLAVLERVKHYWVGGELQSFIDGYAQKTLIEDIRFADPYLAIIGKDFFHNFHVSIAEVVAGPEPTWVYLKFHRDIFRIRPPEKFRWVVNPKPPKNRTKPVVKSEPSGWAFR